MLPTAEVLVGNDEEYDEIQREFQALIQQSELKLPQKANDNIINTSIYQYRDESIRLPQETNQKMIYVPIYDEAVY